MEALDLVEQRTKLDRGMKVYTFGPFVDTSMAAPEWRQRYAANGIP
jgi:hypothetical protein